MYLQDIDTIMLGSDIQRQMVVHMARFDKTLATAARTLTLDHFNWNPAALLAKVLFTHYGQYKRRPPFQILECEVKSLLQTKGQTYIHEFELQQLAETLNLIRSEPEDGLNGEWACDVILEYCTKFQMAELAKDIGMTLQTGGDVEKVLNKASDLLASKGGEQEAVVVSGIDTSEFSQADTRTGKISTGLAKMDNAIGGGLAPGELCLLAALQGVGKTNMLLNFMVSAAQRGLYSLLLSLEMSRQPIQQRILAMTACIPAMKFRKEGFHNFDENDKKRIHDLQQTRFFDQLRIADYSALECTMESIIAEVGKWLDWLETLGVRDKVGVVCIDYLNQIEVPGLKGDKTNLSPDIVKKTIDRLKKEVASKFGIAVYIASQTTSKAEGHQILNRAHVAWGFHANDAIDFGFGLAPKEDTRYQQLDDDRGYGAQPARNPSTTGQELVLSSFKAREGNTTAFTFYQAPTLRAYNSRGDYLSDETALKASRFGSSMTDAGDNGGQSHEA